MLLRVMKAERNKALKSDYFLLARQMLREEVPPEVEEKLDAISNLVR